jgi:hypothetical protein
MMSIFRKFKKLFKQKPVVIKSKNNPNYQSKKIKKLSAKQINAKQQRANQLLRDLLEKEKQKQNKKSKNKLKVTKEQVATETKVTKKPRIKTRSKEQQTAALATNNNTVLYIQATTKRLKVIEWRNLKQKTLLNKEREIRRTHKGGFSQEKFQSFVDMKKAKTADWVELNLTKHGVLRPPYDEIVLEIKEDKVKARVEKITKNF